MRDTQKDQAEVMADMMEQVKQEIEEAADVLGMDDDSRAALAYMAAEQLFKEYSRSSAEELGSITNLLLKRWNRQHQSRDTMAALETVLGFGVNQRMEDMFTPDEEEN